MSSSNSPLIFDREKAQGIADTVADVIKPYSKDVIITGGLRRRLPNIYAIDLVAYPEDHFSMSIALGNAFAKVKSSKPKYEMFIEGMKVDVYIAVTERQYEVLKLVRTGSRQFLLNLSGSANDKGMSLRYSYKEGLCGLYGAAAAFDKEAGRTKMFVNPMRKVAYKENEIIMTVMEDEKYLDPVNRSLGYEEQYSNDL